MSGNLEELRHYPDIEGREATITGSLLPPHLTALSGSEDIGAAPPPVHRGGTGYTPRHSTASALLPISARLVSAFNQRKPPSRTIALAVDISNTFDKVSHRLLIEIINRSCSDTIWRGGLWHISSTGRPRASINSTTHLLTRCG